MLRSISISVHPFFNALIPLPLTTYYTLLPLRRILLALLAYTAQHYAHSPRVGCKGPGSGLRSLARQPAPINLFRHCLAVALPFPPRPSLTPQQVVHRDHHRPPHVGMAR